jgi:hypothetical protein
MNQLIFLAGLVMLIVGAVGMALPRPAKGKETKHGISETRRVRQRGRRVRHALQRRWMPRRLGRVEKDPHGPS